MGWELWKNQSLKQWKVPNYETNTATSDGKGCETAELQQLQQ